MVESRPGAGCGGSSRVVRDRLAGKPAVNRADTSRASQNCRTPLLCCAASSGRVRRTSVAEVALRPVEDSDLDALFDQMRDPESVLMAAFTAKDPNDRDAFDTHMA